MPFEASVQVPQGDAAALSPLFDVLDNDKLEAIATHAFDGAILLQILLPVTATTIPVLKQWIISRQESRKSYRIVVDGIEISGYSAAEAERLLKTFAEEVDNEDRSEPDGG